MLFILCVPFIFWFPVTIYLFVPGAIDFMRMTGAFREHYRFESKAAARCEGRKRGRDRFPGVSLFSAGGCVAGEVPTPRSEVRMKPEGRNPNMPVAEGTTGHFRDLRFARHRALGHCAEVIARQAADFSLRICFRPSANWSSTPRPATALSSAPYRAAPNPDSGWDNPGYSSVRGFPAAAGRWRQSTPPRWQCCAAPAGHW